MRLNKYVYFYFLLKEIILELGPYSKYKSVLTSTKIKNSVNINRRFKNILRESGRNPKMQFCKKIKTTNHCLIIV